MTVTVSEELLGEYGAYLRGEERSAGTVEKYLRDLRCFALWLGSGELTRESVAGWKRHLAEQGLQPVTVNAKLAAVNGLLRFLGREDCRARFLRVQRRMFRAPERDLSREEYIRLVDTARGLGWERLALLMESICATGIRVSEVRCLTVEAARAGRAEIALKGKVRTILLPGKLCRRLLKYAAKKKIAAGELFLTGSGKPLSRGQIWAEMKSVCARAGVDAGKVFPHNLRHLFATAYYKVSRDIAGLADILGHSSIETTRIYLLTTGAEHSRQLERLHLLC